VFCLVNVFEKCVFVLEKRKYFSKTQPKFPLNSQCCTKVNLELKKLWVCLASHCQLPIIVFLPIKSKTFQLFYTFYITSIIFYYYSNKKIHYKTKLFYFSIKHSQILYHINHFLLYNTQIFHNTITYQTSPKLLILLYLTDSF
jgi:hypothetical protein